ncbi:MAG: hypothetical protein GPJ54_05040 [Candidatus Heimdallarchaeota archaeon]|nr:hypothetical protein [Candidatus Heimdallarchaeota archaeon]
MTDGKEYPSWDRGVKFFDFRAALFSISVLIISFLLFQSIIFASSLV